MNVKKELTPETIGPYQIIKAIGRGGMGEVFLAKDPTCDRAIALKRIKPELAGKKNIQDRFLREAKVTSHLSHPSIIPILTIHAEPPQIYYTMPYAEGETLRKILQTTREQEKSGSIHHTIGKSIYALTGIFLQICQAIAHTHEKGILHRDLKPENIIIGKYAEVMILDWGLANFIDKLNEEKKSDQNHPPDSEQMTRPGKIAGTLSYMAPELLKGKQASVQTDIYSLGVILYQMLTLQLPFQRKNLASVKKQIHKEELIDPIEMSPHRDIPHQLAYAATRCLSTKLDYRYKNLDELISDIKKYLEGKPEWILMTSLDLESKEAWQMDETILLAKNIAITKSLESSSWACLKVSKKSFPDNIRIDATVKLHHESQGLGFLFSIPDPDERKSLEEGYCLWLGSATYPSHCLYRSNVNVMESKTLFLESQKTYHIRIEKIQDHIKLFVNDILKLSFTSHLPIAGSHIGLLYKDGHFEIHDWKIYSSSLTATVNCLAVPNSFLSHKLFDIALQEYRKIAQCFPGRIEGREALFRAGLTLLEKGKFFNDEKYFLQALKEFEQLYKTPGAPLEYLGKSLVYEVLDDAEEEAKCLEFALRKFPKHPLLPTIQEHILYRMHESSLKSRSSAYRLIFLALRKIPQSQFSSEIFDLINSLEKNWEPLPFIEHDPNRLTLISIILSFWLRKIPILIEMIQELLKQEPINETLVGNILFCLIELDAEKEIANLPLVAGIDQLFTPIDQLEAEPWNKRTSRIFYYQIRKALMEKKSKILDSVFAKLHKVSMNKEDKILFDSLEIWHMLLKQDMKSAEAILRKYPSTILTQENSYLHFPFGTWIFKAKGSKMANAHFSACLDVPYPQTQALPSYFLSERISANKKWIDQAFWWEKKELQRQLDLFSEVVGETKKKHKSE